jgi:cytochrome c oxidase cbb3-type subunit 4
VDTILPILKQFWVVWMMVLFVGIVVWVFWPSRRKRMEDDGRIPFRDEGGTDGRQG